MDDGPDLFTIVPIVFAAVGGFTVLKTLWSMVRESAFTRSAATAEGEVTDVRTYTRRRSSDHGSRTVTTYAPVLRFALPDGRQVDAESYEEAGKSPPAGARVAIRYDPEDPTRCRLDGRTAGRWGTHAVQLVFGALFLVIGVAMLGFGRAF